MLLEARLSTVGLVSAAQQILPNVSSSSTHVGHSPAQDVDRVVVSTEGTAAPVLETRAHEGRADEEHGDTGHDGGEDLA